MKEKFEKLKRGLDFSRNDIWDIDLMSLSPVRRIGVKTLRIVHLVFRGFREDECPLHASALTFSTLMSIVPILAISLAIARGLGDEEAAKMRIRNAIKGWTQQFEMSAMEAEGVVTTIPGVSENELYDTFSPEHLATGINRVVDWVFQKAENVNFTTIGSVGLVVLLLMVVQTLGQVESSFNRVWGVSQGRSIWRRFTDYMSVTVLTVAALSIPVADLASRFIQKTAAAGFGSLLGEGVIKEITMLAVVWMILSVAIKFMPNTRVHIKSAVAGGIVAAFLFRLWLWLCAAIQVGAAKYGKVYGSFAVIPVLLAWIYVSWEIILFGAEVAFATQNCTTYRMEQDARFASVRSRIILALSVVADAAKAMSGNAKSLEVSSYARSKCIPVRFLNSIIDELGTAKIIGSLADDNGMDTYVLLKAPDVLKVSDVVDVIMSSGVRPEALGLGRIDSNIMEIVEKYAWGRGESMAEMKIKELIGA